MRFEKSKTAPTNILCVSDYDCYLGYFNYCKYDQEPYGFWGNKKSITAAELREIADKLDKLNKGAKE
jgi:hypothetical protein